MYNIKVLFITSCHCFDCISVVLIQTIFLISNYDNEVGHLNNEGAPLSNCEGDQTVKFSKMRQNLCEITQINAKPLTE